MSLAALAELKAGAPLQNARNVLIYDIERIPGRAKVQHRGLTIEGDFWDLNGWKSVIGRRIHADDVIEWPRTICGAWRWYGKNRIHFAAEWQKGGHDGMLDKLWAALDKADIVVGHNIRGFDNRKMLASWIETGRPSPSPFKTFDTLTEARKAGFESNTLDALCKRLNIPAKTDRYSVDVARAAVSGNRKMQARIKSYNCGDIDASTALYDRLRPHSSTHPHSTVGTADDRLTCHACWGDNLKHSGTRLAQVLMYDLYRCLDCGANVQGLRHSRVAITRGVA